MKKRILSLLLAVCMVAAVVPALLISVIAAENKGFTTTVHPKVGEVEAENWPAYSGKEFLGYVGNWEVGHYKNGVYARADKYTNDDGIILSVDGSQWGSTGLYLSSKTDNRAILTTSKYMEGTTCAFAFTYTAQYEGTIDVGFTTLTPMVIAKANPANPAVYAAIFVNDVMVWPTANAVPEDASSFAVVSSADDVKNHKDADKLSNISINIGDRVAFVAGDYNTDAVSIVPYVTYHDGYQVAPSRYSQSFNPSDPTWPATRNLQGVGAMKQLSTKWTIGGYEPATKTFTAYTAQYRNSNFGDIGGIDKDHISTSKNNGIVIDHNNGKISGAYMFGTEAGEPMPAFVTTAVATAKAEFTSTTVLLTKSDASTLKNTSAAVDIYVNGVLKGTMTISSNDRGAASITSVTGIDVKKGDQIIFAAKRLDDTNVKYLLATPTINYTEITSFMSTETTEKYDIATDDAKVVVSGGKVGLQFNAYATIDVYRDATAANVYVWDSSVTGEKTLENAVAVIPMATDSNFAYVGLYQGFSPKEMSDTITAQVVILKGEETLCTSPAATFSVADAAQKQYETSTSDDERALMVAVMNYGAYAQKYFKYNTENLANKGLPVNSATIDIEDYQYFSKFVGDRGGHGDALLTYSDLDAFSLYIEDTISIRLYLDLNEWEKNNAQDMYIRYGDEETYASNNGPQLAIDRESGSALLEGLTLNDLSEVFYFQLASKEWTTVGKNNRLYTYYGYVWQYSVESFVARMMDSTEANLPELLCAMMELSKLSK